MNTNGDSIDSIRERRQATALCINLARFDFVSIRLAVLCAEFGSLAVAARLACMSKSNASYRLTNLETSLGTVLFVRNPRGLQITPAGTLFLEHGRAILQMMDQLGMDFASNDRTEVSDV